AAVLAQPWADMVLSGAGNTDQLAQNLAALRVQVPADALPELAVDARTYWQERAALPWN
ncbi:aldo/keto reductase, partial [Deinococcus sp. 23YEL01]|nr:aldo/keto reductase [Deinococcus sp. 23YEL01]